MFFAIFFLASHELHYLEDFFLPQLAALTVLCTHAAFFVWSFQDWFLRGFFGYVIYNYSETIMVCINTGCTNFFFFLVSPFKFHFNGISHFYVLAPSENTVLLFTATGRLISSALWT